MSCYAENFKETIVSKFIVSTCQLLAKSPPPVSYRMHDVTMSRSPAEMWYMFECGSFAEFYIQPLNTCIGDYDHMMCHTVELVFSGNSPVIPSDMSGLPETISCYKIEPYKNYPSFVRLLVFGELNYNWTSKKYDFKNTASVNNYLVSNLETIAIFGRIAYRRMMKKSDTPRTVCGPAIKSQRGPGSLLDSDRVRSIFCPGWPQEAQRWPRRRRKYGWPTMDTISEVLQNGCHVVYAQHRACRDDIQQWRFSFSISEVILLQSWTQTQQIVYHLLRFFAKRELIQKDCHKKDEVLCMYHLKTLMLWTCEEMPPEWWNSSSVIVICRKLLIKLSEWLKRRYIPNFFIPEANLFLEPSNFAMLRKTERRLNDFRYSGSLSHWFVERYIMPITRTHLKFLDTKKVEPGILYYLQPILEYRKKNELKSLIFLLFIRFSDSSKYCRRAIKYRCGSGIHMRFQKIVSFNPITHNMTPNLSTIQKTMCCMYYEAVLHILHAAYGLLYGEISWNGSLFLEVVNAISRQPKIIKSRYHNFPKTFKEQNYWFQFLRAQNLMQILTGSNSNAEFRLVSLLSKEFLVKALECGDLKLNEIVPTALAYLAALHFATSQYKQVIRLCSALLVDNTSHTKQEPMNAGCLLFIDDIARILGMHLLQNKITGNNFHYIGRKLYLDLRLSPQVCAYYLTALLTASFMDGIFLALPNSAYPVDDYLKAVTKVSSIASSQSMTSYAVTKPIVYIRTDSLTDKSVIDILMEYALENVTSFYSVIRKDYAIQCNTDDCYRALYLYKCGKFDATLRMCERILCDIDTKQSFEEFSFVSVLLLPPFDAFFDGDIQSLLGFHTLLYYLSPMNFEMLKSKEPDECDFPTNVDFLGYKLSVVNSNCSIKCNYFLGRHFLASFLKVRCCMSCCVSLKEALADFVAQKTTHPFERIIRKFLLQKLRFISGNH